MITKINKRALRDVAEWQLEEEQQEREDERFSLPYEDWPLETLS